MSFDGDSGSEWNVLAVSTEYRIGRAQAALAEFGRFRSGGFPRVMTGCVDDLAALHERVAVAAEREARSERDPFARALSRVVAVERALLFEREDVTETVCDALEPLAGRLAGKSFFVRAKLRGLKGRLEHPVVERAIGAFLVGRVAADGGPPAEVSFDDPDVVVVIEVVGSRVGYAFLDREARQLPLLRVR